MRFGSLFSGIGGFDLGLERAGMGCAWQVEIDSKCREVLRRHWPDVPHHEDVTKIGGNTLEPVDLICGGFPCQDLSVAGRRAGLAGERSGLFFEFLRIVGELAPRWVLIENVPGLLSSNEGRDMGAVLDGLGQLGYGYAWRILDSQYFGVPQRRCRVFIVGRAGGVCPPEVLFEPESLPGDSPPSRETGQGVAANVIKGAAIGRNPSAGPQYGEALEDGSCYTLNCTEVHAVSGHDVVAFNLRGRESGAMPEADDLASIRSASGGSSRSYVAHTLRAEGHDASEDGTGRGTPLVARGVVPRRLTPRECERLQAFPDDWTRYDSEDREITDSPRYRMLGNAVTVTVASWIGRRIMSENR